MADAFDDDAILAASASQAGAVTTTSSARGPGAAPPPGRRSGSVTESEMSQSFKRRSRAQSLHEAVQAFRELADDYDNDGSVGTPAGSELLLRRRSSAVSALTSDDRRRSSVKAAGLLPQGSQSSSPNFEMAKSTDDLAQEATMSRDADPDQWMHKWVAAADAQRTDIAVSTGHLENNRAVFGPPCGVPENDDDGAATNIKAILLKSEADYNDAIAFSDRANFLSDPFDCTRRHVTSAMVTCANAYNSIRDLFQGMSFELAVSRLDSHTSLMRALRSMVYLSESVGNSAIEIRADMQRLIDLKIKHEATIQTLRRQLADFHGTADSVGRGIDGKFELQERPGAAGAMVGSMPGGGADEAKGTYVVAIQIEEAVMFRRKLGLLRELMRIAKEAIVTTAPTFRCTRSNYFEEDEKLEAQGKSPTITRSFLFTAENSYDAYAFAVALQDRFHDRVSWPPALLSAGKYNQDLWRGLRIRAGVHFGELTDMDIGDSTSKRAVKHYEGPAVEKTLRVTALGVAGDVCITNTAFDRYMACSLAGTLPNSEGYKCLRGIVTVKQDAPARFGFRRSDFIMRSWSAALGARKTSPCEATEFCRPAFYQLEAPEGAGDGGECYDDDAEPPSSEDLLRAKESEISVMQQELDTLRLAILKRDEDISEIRQSLYFALAKVEERSRVREVIATEHNRCLENQLMAAHDDLTALNASLTADGDRPGTARSRRSRVSSVVTDNAPPSEQGTLGPSGSEQGVGLALEVPSFGETLRSPQSWTISPNSNASKNVDKRWRDLLQEAGVMSAEDKVREFVQESEARREASKKAKRDQLIAEMTGSPTASATTNQSSDKDPIVTMVSGPDPPQPAQASPRGSLKKKKSGHRNQRLWRDLMSMVESSAQPSVSVALPKKVDSGVFGSQRGPSPMLRAHSVVKVFDTLVKRFVMEADRESDVDNKGISEDQFMKLFVTKAQNDQLTSGGSGKSRGSFGGAGGTEGWKLANSRDQMSWLTALAIESDDAEIAHRFDDSRLARSIAGHLATVFMTVRTLKRSALNAQQKLEEAKAGNTLSANSNTTGRPRRKSISERNKDHHAAVKGSSSPSTAAITLHAAEAGTDGAHKAAPQQQQGRRRSKSINAADMPKDAALGGIAAAAAAAAAKVQQDKDKKAIDTLTEEVTKLRAELTRSRRDVTGRRRSMTVSGPAPNMSHLAGPGTPSSPTAAGGTAADAATGTPAHGLARTSSVLGSGRRGITTIISPGDSPRGEADRQHPQRTGPLTGSAPSIPPDAAAAAKTTSVAATGAQAGPRAVSEGDFTMLVTEPTRAVIADPELPSIATNPAAVAAVHPPSPTAASSGDAPSAAASPVSLSDWAFARDTRPAPDDEALGGASATEAQPLNTLPAASAGEGHQNTLAPFDVDGMAKSPRAAAGGDRPSSALRPLSPSAAPHLATEDRAGRRGSASVAPPSPRRRSVLQPSVQSFGMSGQQQHAAGTAASHTAGGATVQSPSRRLGGGAAKTTSLEKLITSAKAPTLRQQMQQQQHQQPQQQPSPHARSPGGGKQPGGSFLAQFAPEVVALRNDMARQSGGRTLLVSKQQPAGEAETPAPAHGALAGSAGANSAHAGPQTTTVPPKEETSAGGHRTAMTPSPNAAPGSVGAQENLAMALLLRPNAVSAPPAHGQELALGAVARAPARPSEVARKTKQEALTAQLEEVRSLRREAAAAFGALSPSPSLHQAGMRGQAVGRNATPTRLTTSRQGDTNKGRTSNSGGSGGKPRTGSLSGTPLQRADSKRGTFAVVKSVNLQQRGLAGSGAGLKQH